MREALRDVLRASAATAIGLGAGFALASQLARCDVPAIPIPPAGIPTTGPTLEDCTTANMSMATALEALAGREDGCAKFLSLTTDDPWIAHRLRHAPPASGLSSPASSPGSARSPASPASGGPSGSTRSSPSGRVGP